MKVGTLLKTTFQKYFLVGVFVLLPFWVTAKLLLFFVNYLDSILEVRNGRFLYLIPAEFHPDFIFGFHLPGLGVLFTVGIVLFVGVLSRNYAGKQMIRWGDRMMVSIPLARVIYNVVKQMIETYASSDKKGFTRVVMVEFPRKGIYSLGFVTGVATGEVQYRTKETVINVFIPTTPNPTSGFYLMVPETDVIECDMSIEDAFKLIVSGGMVSPAEKVRVDPVSNAVRF